MFAVLVIFGDQQVRALRIVHPAVADHFHQRFRFFDDRIRSFLGPSSSPSTAARSPDNSSSSLAGVPGAARIAWINSSGVFASAASVSGNRRSNAFSSRVSNSTRSRLPSPRSRSRFDVTRKLCHRAVAA